MAHIPFRDDLTALANGTSGDPMGFLDGLSDIHADWHSEQVRTYGFLLFHHRVVGYFTSIVNAPLALGITAYTPADFAQFGVPALPANVTDGVDTLAELASFSRRVESWHNSAHGQLTMSTGAPLMDPRQNIFFTAFWRLHLYIEGLFAAVLGQYAQAAHPGQLLTPDVVAGHLEASHHGWVPLI